MARKPPGDTAFQPENEESVGHPLFPVEGDDDVPIVAYINVTRFEAGGQVWSDKLFTGEELTELSQIRDLYGGGHYEIIGRLPAVRDPRKPGNYSARRRIKIPGRSLPLGTNVTQEDDAGNVSVAPPVAAGGGGGGLGGDQILLAILQMSQQQQAADRQAQQQASQQFMQLMMNFIASSKTDSTAMTTMMMQMSQQQQQSMVSMITAMMANRGGGPEEMAKYAELLKSLGVGAAKKDDEDGEGSGGVGKMLEDFADSVQGIAQVLPMLKQMPAADGPPPPEGSAASVIAGKKAIG